ncbi:MAG: RNA polymerase sigma factor RpoD/SigA [Lewinellaceae bacterium]|nr:RNA polymerase sigma factor RpoD/SigA [Saprospiraceae bacterium]MCB9333321.1 RNA polymerase sigma factor RpoD/SigA [Lewinellaceae bacterium]
MRALKITQSITRRDEKSLEKYLTEISRYDVLTPEEEVQLFQRIREGDDEALVKVVRHNLRFVVSVAKQYQNLGLWLGDLVNEGNIGLIKAARRFDETRGFKFISYAVWWIRQSILQAVNDKAQKIRVPLNLKGVGAKVRASHQEILQKQEREPTLDELAEATGLTPELVKKSLDTYKMCSSLDAPLNSDSEGSLVHVLEDDSIVQPDFELSIRESQKEEVQQLLSMLTPRQATVLSMYYGIGRKQPASLGDIGEQIGLSRERVRQIMNRGVRKLRLRARKMDPTFSVN